MRIGRHTYVIEYGHLALITLIAGLVFWYLLDARSVSLSVNNLLLVEPVSLFTLALYAFIVPQCFHRVDEAEAAAIASDQDPLSPTAAPDYSDLIKMGALSVALGLMVFLLETIGFDIAVFLFSAAAMVVCGERRPLRVLVFSLAVTAVAIYGFRAMIPYPMPTTLL
ncbi:tripartite tricarboxylate transporter TctB family protein [Ancylobacter sp. MQZ15Z-1]|uniref:Tripartite tricarboxylate transporter TctB family protein n=1 Tax=Ancylobacter mangrovi TaxID=2972472 RepID=A0A9X2PCY4_9HYPH|nr:tripartite tricarboxylate transporter TctB family protein [Ancylobacter mangrovi]MCS0494581.1 tripartite tricarboxylate transporter TctB family protein [Ancylobacter mangrovi]